jgi:hypothetical protein
MKKLGYLLVLAPVVLLSACETITTKRDFDAGAKFAEYKTYAWAPEPNTQTLATPAVDQAIRDAADKDLAARGFTKAAGNAPDFYAVYHLTMVEKTDVRDYTAWGFGTAYRSGYGYYLGWPVKTKTDVEVSQNPVGALILDFVEVRRQQLVWRGVASSAVEPGKPDGNAVRAAQAVHLLLAKFPPEAVPPKP